MATASEASQQANRSGIDPKRLVVIFYLVTGIVLALFLEHVFGLLWSRFGWSDVELFEGLGWRVSTLVGYVVALALVLAAYFHPRTHTLSIDVASELMKVTWPTWSETRASTMAVVVASLVAAVLLFCIDTVAYNLMVEWLPALWGKL
ncbi:preprotein translocase subunit SecE [Corallococcus exiguus]|uniref:Protein translocase subunit SecE n=1 Tax=Corallococcus exiguus TaxID=83462 RepID=A0A7Y1WX37_9BACT|nr:MULTISPECIES: preprotein translocase subunit SecE [Corallococcus]NBC44225.1 preprotein translocase subunit SecE [Corallococcus exiguus]NNC17235.1 preprotein translocase subunit SecE [Corallococcus exiguus]NRD54761.1 preprotein translocase subunit SecE [Corallococcus exiguus]NRD60668.1 preprotein translocase subunit SecE [Corallococcus exiguus]RKH24717.1 preprotein translocase subunit SecE [Corallococcus sp. CA041A]